MAVVYFNQQMGAFDIFSHQNKEKRLKIVKISTLEKYKKMILTSKLYAKHLFVRPNTQHVVVLLLNGQDCCFSNKQFGGVVNVIPGIAYKHYTLYYINSLFTGHFLRPAYKSNGEKKVKILSKIIRLIREYIRYFYFVM